MIGAPSTDLPTIVTNPLDKWLLSKIEGLTDTVTKYMDAYDVVSATRPLMAFAKEFSTWYLRLSRDRLRTNKASQNVLGYALRRYCLLMAPFTPFMAERIYQNLSHPQADLPNALDSIHLEMWPTRRGEVLSPELEKSMETVMQIVEKGHAARKLAAIRLRQPLSSVSITETLTDDLKQLIADELNVKVVLSADVFSLDVALTPELVAEGFARDLMRDIQGARKKQGLNPSDVVTVELPVSPNGGPAWPESWAEEIKKKVGASTLIVGTELKVTKI